ncbi:unnamed protein product, partial [Arabidopsis lyrata]
QNNLPLSYFSIQFF